MRFSPGTNMTLMALSCAQAGLDELSMLKSVRVNLYFWWAEFFGCLIAALLFLVGSVFFIPEYAAHINTGCIMFVCGVCLFWIGSAWSFYNYKSRHDGASTPADLLAKRVCVPRMMCMCVW